MDLYDLFTLQAVQRQIKTSPRFWLENFYKSQINFDGRKILFERVYGEDRKLAPFVVPNVAGRPQRLDGFQMDTFTPAYSKQKDIVDYTMHITRQAGEAIGGSLTTEQRRNAVIAELIRRQNVKIENTWNWLAARATIDGKVVIKGEDYPETLVDFRRNAELTRILTGAAKWDEPTGNPLQDLREMRQAANQFSFGARISKYYFGTNAWELFCQRVDLKEMMRLEYAGRGQNTSVTLISDGYDDTIEYMGSIAGLNGQGRMEFYVDSSKYIDPETGEEAYHLGENDVVGVSDMMDGVRCFGGIMDAEAGYRALDRFFKNWREQDPSQEYLLTQSAPLMVPRETNATFKITVAQPVTP